VVSVDAKKKESAGAIMHNQKLISSATFTTPGCAPAATGQARQ
jgi:hypothetical protein